MKQYFPLHLRLFIAMLCKQIDSDLMGLEHYHCNYVSTGISGRGMRALLLRWSLSGIFLYYTTYCGLYIRTYIIDGFTPTLNLMYVRIWNHFVVYAFVYVRTCVCHYTYVHVYVCVMAESSKNKMAD